MVTMQGDIDNSIINKCRMEAAQLAKQHNCMQFLADLREAVSAVSTIDIYQQPQATSAKLASQGQLVHKFRRALVVSEKLQDAVFFETVARNQGQNVKVFRDIEAAKKWLSES